MIKFSHIEASITKPLHILSHMSRKSAENPFVINRYYFATILTITLHLACILGCKSESEGQPLEQLYQQQTLHNSRPFDIERQDEHREERGEDEGIVVLYIGSRDLSSLFSPLSPLLFLPFSLLLPPFPPLSERSKSPPPA